MFKITYKEYLKYEELYGKIEDKQSLCVAEEVEEYIYKYDKNNKYDKVFRDVLSIKEEAIYLINKAIKHKKQIKEVTGINDKQLEMHKRNLLKM